MATRLTILAALTAAAFINGCGPGKEGMKARADAQDRMNLVSAQIHFDQARQSFKTGQFEKALREITHAIGRYDKVPEYYLLLGRIHLETHQLESALEAFKKSAELKPQAAEAHYFSGIVHQRWSNDQQAYSHYIKAAELEPSNVQYLLAAAESLISTGEIESARRLIEPRIAYFEHNSALRQLQAQIALLQGNPTQAAKLYSEARLLNPDDDMLLEELMWAQYAAGMYGQSLDSLKRLQSRSNCKRTDLLHLEARCLTMLGRGIEARDRYLELSRSSPADPVVWSELGALAWDLGDYRRVAQCSVQIIALAPERYEGYMLKGINERHHKNLNEAVRLFQEAAKRAPSVALPHLLLGQTLEQAGDLQLAKRAYRGALNAEPGSAEATVLLGRLNDAERMTAAPTQ